MQMPGSGRINLGSPELRGRVRVRSRSVYASVPRRFAASIDGVVFPGVNKQETPKVPHTVQSKSSSRSHHRSQASLKPALPRQSRSAVLARHTVTTKRQNKPSAFASKRSKKRVSLIFLVVVLFFGGTGVSYSGWRSQKKAAVRASVLASTISSEALGTVSEEAVSKEVMANYVVAPEMPKLIKIPRLQVNARVKRIGVNTAGILEAPSNVHDAGWYEGSAKPGRNDTTLINGHVQGAENPGVFARLSILREGDSIQIERGDDKVIEYKVIRTESVDQDKVDLEKILTNGSPNKSSLVLMTSSSRYDVRTNKYEQSFIVYAVEQ